MPVRFMLNEEIVELCPPSDEDDETCNNLRDDNELATKMILQMAEINQIKVQQPITRITCLITETENEVIFIAGDTGKETPQYVPDYSENCDPADEAHNNNVWDDIQTRFILDQYHTDMTQIGPMKKFKTKKVMWNQIAKDLKEKLDIVKSAIQVENRYKTIIRRKKIAVDNNSKSGSSRQEVEYEPELSKISNLDDSIEPECIRSATKVKRLKEPVIQSDSDEGNEENSATKKRFRTKCQGKGKKKDPA